MSFPEGVTPYSKKIEKMLHKGSPNVPEYIGREFPNGLKVVAMKDATLVPSSETYELGLTIQAAILKSPAISRALDSGTGSGLLGLMMSIDGVNVTVSDISNAALDMAVYNFQLNSLPMPRIIQADMFANPELSAGGYDLIVSNPPFYTVGRYSGNTFEPDIALNGGDSGLEYYKKIFSESRGLLTPHGGIVVQIQELNYWEVLAIANKYYPHWGTHTIFSKQKRGSGLAVGPDEFLNLFGFER